jgi:hypothetical protein
VFHHKIFKALNGFSGNGNRFDIASDAGRVRELVATAQSSTFSAFFSHPTIYPLQHQLAMASDADFLGNSHSIQLFHFIVLL